MDSFESCKWLFVYGWLMRGQERQGFLSADKARFCCPATMHGKLYAIGDFPGLVINSSVAVRSEKTVARSQSSTISDKERQEDGKPVVVHGELYEILDPVTFFETLDLIEGYWPDQPERSLFVRKLVPVETENGIVTAWVYILNLPINGLPSID